MADNARINTPGVFHCRKSKTNYLFGVWTELAWYITIIAHYVLCSISHINIGIGRVCGWLNMVTANRLASVLVYGKTKKGKERKVEEEVRVCTEYIPNTDRVCIIIIVQCVALHNRHMTPICLSQSSSSSPHCKTSIQADIAWEIYSQASIPWLYIIVR